MTAPATSRPAGEGRLFARVNERITVDVAPDGKTVARFPGHAVELGKLGPDAAARARELGNSLALDAFASPTSDSEKELFRLVRRLAVHGLMEWCLGGAPDHEADVIIEPQLPDYWPRVAPLHASDVLVLSRFAGAAAEFKSALLVNPYDPEAVGSAILQALEMPLEERKQRQRPPV